MDPARPAMARAAAIAKAATAIAVMATAAAPLAACGSCTKDDAGGAQPPMPSGMLVPAPAPAETTDTLRGRLTVSRTPKAGWFQIAVARDGGLAAANEGRWISPAAMTILENAFGRAQPGFTPYGKRDVGPENVGALARELRELDRSWRAFKSPAHARATYGALVVHEGETDESWPAARAAFGTTLEDLAAFCDERAKKGEGVVVVNGT